VGPEALEARQHVAILRQLHLRLGVGRLGAHGKDVEDEAGAVEDLHAQFLLYVADLACRQLIVENDHAYGLLRVFSFLDIVSDLFELALADIGRLAGASYALGVALHGHGACRVGEKFQLVKIFFGLGLVLVLGDQSDQNGGFGLGLGYDKFFHPA